MWGSGTTSPSVHREWKISPVFYYFSFRLPLLPKTAHRHLKFSRRENSSFSRAILISRGWGEPPDYFFSSLLPPGPKCRHIYEKSTWRKKVNDAPAFCLKEHPQEVIKHVGHHDGWEIQEKTHHTVVYELLGSLMSCSCMTLTLKRIHETSRIGLQDGPPHSSQTGHWVVHMRNSSEWLCKSLKKKTWHFKY